MYDPFLAVFVFAVVPGGFVAIPPPQCSFPAVAVDHAAVGRQDSIPRSHLDLPVVSSYCL